MLTQAVLELSDYELRPGVTLTDTPALPIGKSGCDVETLQPGEGGEEALAECLGWKKGRDFRVLDGGLQSTSNSKL